MREISVENYLVREVKRNLGEARKLRGRRNECDRAVLWPAGNYASSPGSQVWIFRSAHVHFVETKAPGKKPRPGQVREHKRLRDMGFEVFVLDTKAKVKEYVFNHSLRHT